MDHSTDHSYSNLFTEIGAQANHPALPPILYGCPRVILITLEEGVTPF